VTSGSLTTTTTTRTTAMATSTSASMTLGAHFAANKTGQQQQHAPAAGARIQDSGLRKQDEGSKE